MISICFKIERITGQLLRYLNLDSNFRQLKYKFLIMINIISRPGKHNESALVIFFNAQ